MCFNVTSNNLADATNFQILKDSFIGAVVQEAESSWQNPLEPLNINADEFIAPLDALLLINALSDYPDGVLPLSLANRPDYLDPDGNGSLSPLDPLLVINQLTFISQYDSQFETLQTSNVPGVPASFDFAPASAARINAVGVDATMAQLASEAPVSSPLIEPLSVHESGQLADPFQARMDIEADAENQTGWDYLS